MSTAYHHGDLRNVLLAEASVVLEESGVEAISMRQLARRAGVSHAAPAHHFGSRDGLLAQLATDGFTRLADQLEAALATATPPDRAAVGRAYVLFALDHPERYRLMFTTGITSGDCCPELGAASMRAYMALLSSVYGDLAGMDPQTYRLGPGELGAWSTVHGAVMLYIDGQLAGPPTREEFLALVDQILS